MTATESTVYAYSKRGVLRPGDRFKVSGGPYYISRSGDKIPMHERGTFIFRTHVKRGSREYLEAVSVDGGFYILTVGHKLRSKVDPALVNRPYRVRKVRD